MFAEHLLHAGHCSGCQCTKAKVHNRHRIIKRTQKKPITSYPGGSRKASLKKETLEGVLKDEKKMVEEGIPSVGWEAVCGAEVPVTSNHQGNCCPAHLEQKGRQGAKMSLGRQDKVTRDLDATAGLRAPL